MNEITITNAQYAINNKYIKAIIEGVEMYVPLDPANSDYAEIMRQVDAGTLTIADAD